MPAVSHLAGFLKRQAVLLEYLACVVCGFILSNAFLLGQLAPFGVAFAAAGKKRASHCSGCGCAFGIYFFRSPGEQYSLYRGGCADGSRQMAFARRT